MMVMRKKNPLTLTFRDYLNSKDSFKMIYEEWKKEGPLGKYRYM